MLLADVVDVSLGGGGGGGAATPGESIIPASTELASDAVRIARAQIRFSLLTFLYLPVNTKIFV